MRARHSLAVKSLYMAVALIQPPVSGYLSKAFQKAHQLLIVGMDNLFARANTDVLTLDEKRWR